MLKFKQYISKIVVNLYLKFKRNRFKSKREKAI